MTPEIAFDYLLFMVDRNYTLELSFGGTASKTFYAKKSELHIVELTPPQQAQHLVSEESIPTWDVWCWCSSNNLVSSSDFVESKDQIMQMYDMIDADSLDLILKLKTRWLSKDFIIIGPASLM